MPRRGGAADVAATPDDGDDNATWTTVFTGTATWCRLMMLGEGALGYHVRVRAGNAAGWSQPGPLYWLPPRRGTLVHTGTPRSTLWRLYEQAQPPPGVDSARLHQARLLYAPSRPRRTCLPDLQRLS
jgi:hypothetical protein